MIEPGSPAPDFTLRDQNGDAESAADLAGHVEHGAAAGCTVCRQGAGTPARREQLGDGSGKDPGYGLSRVAAATGEGASAIASVHQALAGFA